MFNHLFFPHEYPCHRIIIRTFERFGIKIIVQTGWLEGGCEGEETSNLFFPCTNFSVWSCKLFQISSLIQLFRETPLYQRQVYPCSGFSSIEWLQRIRNLNNNTKFYNLIDLFIKRVMLALACAPSYSIISYNMFHNNTEVKK